MLDLSRLLPGGFCSLLLADFGADVIKVEDTGIGDYVRWSEPHYEGADRTASSALFLALNRGKRSIRIDLKTDAGKLVLVALARDADVLLESFRPGVLDRLGVGYERLRQENPRLVYCAISGYGQDGPKTDRSGHDMNYLGLNGILGLTGDADGPPVQSAGQIADLGGGATMAAFGILMALRERERSGEGQLVDCSMFDGSLSWLAMVAAEMFARGRTPARGELPLAGGLTCYRPYRCADGYVTLGALEPKFWSAVLPRRRARGPDRAPARPARLRRPPDGVGDLRHAHPRAVAPVRHPARLLPGAGARARRGAALRAGGGARDGGRARPTGLGAAGQAAWSPDQAEPDSGRSRPGRRDRRSASTPTSCWQAPATAPTRSPRCTRPARSPVRPMSARAAS